jgi:phosphopantothenoylcysteine decarboxylase/phosphopantothenate--cysteine ligase
MPIRVLITAGPTHEPIDSVRFLGNRSSGKMGIALAAACQQAGYATTLCLGPVCAPPPSAPINTQRFRTCADLQGLLQSHAPQADLIIMAAAVADYRPKPLAAISGGKFRRTSEPVSLELEPTPDLIASVAASRRAGQVIVGFALEPREEMIASARAKITRKGLDACIANPLETMDSPVIEGTLVYKDGRTIAAPCTMLKEDFAIWVLGELRSIQS